MSDVLPIDADLGPSRFIILEEHLVRIHYNGVGQSTLLGGDVGVEWICDHQKWIICKGYGWPSITFMKFHAVALRFSRFNDPMRWTYVLFFVIVVE